MDIWCEICDDEEEDGPRRGIIEIGLTYMGMAGKLRVCAICAGIVSPNDGPMMEHAPLERIIYSLQRKMERLQEQQQTPPQG